MVSNNLTFADSVGPDLGVSPLAEKFSSFRNGECVCYVCGFGLAGHDGLKCSALYDDSEAEALSQRNVASLSKQRAKLRLPEGRIRRTPEDFLTLENGTGSYREGPTNLRRVSTFIEEGRPTTLHETMTGERFQTHPVRVVN